MDPARIAELLQPFLAESSPSPAVKDLSFRAGFSPEESAVLSPAQLQSISTYINLLLRWNSRINLTSVRDPEQIGTRHFGESLFAARHLFPFPVRVVAGDSPARVPHPSRFSKGGDWTDHVIDLGSGAGFPGLPIKIWDPSIRLTLIESNHKKATFLREVIRALTLTNVNVFAGRVEEFGPQTPLSTQQESAKGNERRTVTVRAVEHYDAVLSAAVRLVGPGGRLALLIGQSQASPTLALASKMKWFEPVLVPLSSSRILLVGEAGG